MCSGEPSLISREAQQQRIEVLESKVLQLEANVTMLVAELLPMAESVVLEQAAMKKQMDEENDVLKRLFFGMPKARDN